MVLRSSKRSPGRRLVGLLGPLGVLASKTEIAPRSRISLAGSIALVVLALARPVAAADPVVMLIEHDPWSRLIGADSPTFALYSDGQVIYRPSDATPARPFLSLTLSPSAQKKLLKKLDLPALLELEDSYQLRRATDQPLNAFQFRHDGKEKSIAAYGYLRRDEETRRACPRVLLKAFDTLTQFSGEGEPWLPEKIEVLLVPYGDETDRAVPWPASWPGIETARRRAGDEMHQVLLPSSESENLRSFMEQQREGRGVALDGRRWSIFYRLPFPGERDMFSLGP